MYDFALVGPLPKNSFCMRTMAFETWRSRF